jgi:hypothetical protein
VLSKVNDAPLSLLSADQTPVALEVATRRPCEWLRTLAECTQNAPTDYNAKPKPQRKIDIDEKVSW